MTFGNQGYRSSNTLHRRVALMSGLTVIRAIEPQRSEAARASCVRLDSRSCGFQGSQMGARLEEGVSELVDDPPAVVHLRVAL